jgi:hypothetical protein
MKFKMPLKNRYIRSLSFSLLAIVFTALIHGSVLADQAYSSGGRRDPFVPLLGISGVAARSGLQGIASIRDVDLQGIVVSDDGKKSVIINGEVISEGEAVGYISIEKVGANTVVIKIENEEHELELYKDVSRGI